MKHVIIGAGAAGITAARTIRDIQPEALIVIVSEEDKIHSRTMIYKYVSGERSEESLSFVEKDFFDKNKIEWLGGKSVTSIDTSAKKVLCGDEAISYDKLLIAGGAVSVAIPIDAFLKSKNVYGFRSLKDAVAIKDVAASAKRAVIIGGGLVGLDMAYALLKLNIDVTVVEMNPSILSLNFDKKAAKTYQDRFEADGCKFKLGCRVVDGMRDSNGNIAEVQLDDGTSLLCDFVVAAAGVRPNIAFLEGSGIAVTRGITVDKHMQTSAADVYAAGDISGLSGIWPNAMKQGEVAGKNMCGISEEYDDLFTAKNTANFFELTTISLGVLEPADGDKVEVYDDRRGYRKVILRDGVVVGIVMQGDVSNDGFWQHLIKNKLRVDNIGKPIWKLSFADFYAMDERGNYFYKT